MFALRRSILDRERCHAAASTTREAYKLLVVEPAAMAQERPRT
jgi:hypothetical protein